MSARLSASGFGAEAGRFDLRQDESIDRRACPFPIVHGRQRRAARARRTPNAASSRRPAQSSSLSVVFCPSLSVLWRRERRHPPRGIGFRDFLVEKAFARACPAQPARRSVARPARLPEGRAGGSPCASTRRARDRENSCPTGSDGHRAGSSRASAPRRVAAGACTSARAAAATPTDRQHCGRSSNPPIYQSSNLPMVRQNRKRAPNRIVRSVCARMPVMRPKFALPACRSDWRSAGC